MSAPRVGLLFGGASVEHEVSVISARGILAALPPDRYECVPIGVTETGRWLPPELSGEILRGSTPRVEAPVRDDGARLLADPGGTGLLRVDRSGMTSAVKLDVMFPIVHGWGGEDGRIQGLLDLAGVPYVGSGLVGSAVGMDKEVAKSILESRGIPVGPWTSVTRHEYDSERASTLRRIASRLGFPLFVKPANGGSSVGVSRVAEASRLEAALEEALGCDRKAVIEAAIDAREIECAVLGNERPEASVAGEIVSSREFYDYAAKYLDGTSRLLIPAPISPQTEESVRRLSLETFRALDLQGLARIDFFVERGTDRVLVNEANTLPGFTPISMYPKLWEATGVRYAELLDRLLRLALERGRSEEERLRRYRA